MVGNLGWEWERSQRIFVNKQFYFTYMGSEEQNQLLMQFLGICGNTYVLIDQGQSFLNSWHEGLDV